MTNFEFIKQWVADSSFSYHHGNLSNHGTILKSYNTVIGMKTVDKDNQQVMLVSEERFSNTTAKHISDLVSLACRQWELLFVPFRYEIDYTPQEVSWRSTPNSLISAFVKLLKETKEKSLTIKANRENYVRIFNNLKKFLKCYSLSEPEEFKDLEVVYNKIKTDPTGKVFKDEAKVIREKNNKNLNIFEEKVLKNPLELTTAKSPYGKLQYIREVYYNGQHYIVVTNKLNRAKFATKDMLMESLEKLIKAKESSELDLIYLDGYHVKKIVDQKVYIGCHTIPKRNLKLWYNILKNGYLG